MRYGSVCSGIEAASVAWHSLGWEPVFFAEIEKFPSAVLAHRFPNVPNVGDFTKIEAKDVGPIDLLVGGTPCQSFSFAGKRLGLDDPRGNLALEFCRLARRLRPRWVVWENVPGVHSSWSGAPDGEDLEDGAEWRGPEDSDFGAFLDALEECGYSACWRVLDSQYVRVDTHARAVPQRRQRVFLVGYLGDWRPPAAVLLEPEGLRGDTPPRREAGEGIAGGVTSRAGNGSREAGGNGNLAAVEVAPTLRAGGNQTGGDRPYGTDVDTCDSLVVARSLNAHAGEDGTGRGTPIIPVGYAIQAGATRENIASGPDGVGVQEGTAYTLEARAEVQAIAFDTTQITSKENRCQPKDGDPCHPLSAHAHAPALAFHARQDPDSGTVTHPLDTDGFSIGIQQAWAVRRLTPLECERLQAFPDGWTLIPYRGGWAADGPRYKAIGNSMSTNAMRWIGLRIDLFEKVAVA